MSDVTTKKQDFLCGCRDGVPIALGYLSVAFTFGMMAATQGVPVWASVVISMTNLTSAGQFAGLYWINVMLLAGMQIPLQLFGHAFEISEQGLALLCLPLLWCYHGRQGAHNRKIQLACYAFYPVHMLVLGILSKLIFS